MNLIYAKTVTILPSQVDAWGKLSLDHTFDLFMDIATEAAGAMGADNAQLVKALKEAEHFDGPSVVIAYAPCQSHGLKCGMAKVQDEMKRAVEAGYWHLYRYNPDADPKFTLDSKAPTMDYEEFLNGEVRYASLRRTFPENAEALFSEGARLAQERYEKLAKEGSRE